MTRLCEVEQFLLTDQVGTLRAVADTSGNIVKRIDYDSFGNIIADSNPSFTVPFGFAGGLHDRDTGLVRFGYRDYSPELGRFVAKDPIDFEGGDTNLYAYVSSDPINFTDPLGLLPDHNGMFSMFDPGASQPDRSRYLDPQERAQGEKNLQTFCEVSGKATAFGIGLGVATSGWPRVGAAIFDLVKGLINREPISPPGPIPIEVINPPEAW